MEIKLTDNEIRIALAEEISKKLNYEICPDPEDCWFEASAGEIKGEDIDDIHDVMFCFRTPEP